MHSKSKKNQSVIQIRISLQGEEDTIVIIHLSERKILKRHGLLRLNSTYIKAKKVLRDANQITNLEFRRNSKIEFLHQQLWWLVSKQKVHAVLAALNVIKLSTLKQHFIIHTVCPNKFLTGIQQKYFKAKNSGNFKQCGSHFNLTIFLAKNFKILKTL